MTLDERLLEKLAEWRPTSGRQTLTLAEPATPTRITITADRSDDVAAQLWECVLDRPATLDATRLRAWGEAAARRVTGLLEPLRLLEVDAQRGVALLRSQAPTHRGGQLHYYEVLLQGNGQASLRRYEASASHERKREQIAYALTHEALAKVLADLEAAHLEAAR